ncbi:MAG: hypothetical protein WA771_01020 [Chthoniobacterales bacterium]
MSDTPDNSIYEGLLAMLETEYPKTCPRCGRVFQDLDAFVDGTNPVAGGGTGLMGYDTGEPMQQVAMYRNCSCGSTIATFCGDRRDNSPAGARRRMMFDKLLTQLRENGIAAETARAELIAFLRGKKTDLLDNLITHGAKLQPAA